MCIHPKTLPLLLTLAAVFGIGTIRSAFLAPRDGLLTLKRSVCLLPTSVQLTTKLDCAHLATRAMTFMKESASTLLITPLLPLILAVPLGTGTTRFALPALRDGLSIVTMSVS